MSAKIARYRRCRDGSAPDRRELPVSPGTISVRETDRPWPSIPEDG